MKSNHKAFTLIEMLVVISLIGILAALALVSFTSAQKQARDTTRKSDLKQYQTAVEGYALKNNDIYPIHGSSVPANTTLCTDLDIGSCPADPKNTSPYTYRYISDASGLNYALWGGLENNSTTTYWIVCSNGKNGTSTSAPSGGTICPL